MAKSIGITLAERVASGLVEGGKLVGPLHFFPENENDDDAMVELHAEALVKRLCEQVVVAAAGATDVAAVGVALPGLIKQGVVEEAPNFPQLKGARVQEMLNAELQRCGITAPVKIFNDADAVAAGLAAQQGKLDTLVRVWTLGTGIGYGRYPFVEGVWEGGHTVVTLEDKETYCGCGGRGHLEGIMGHRAMRLRFLDMEPEEVFAAAKEGDHRCCEFKKLWHKALAAATASAIHVSGPGKFYLTGFNVRFVELSMLKDYLRQMVKMSPLQSYSVEIMAAQDETEVVGAGVMAAHALR